MHVAPARAHEAAEPLLSGMGGTERELFRLRLDRWWGDLVAGLVDLYPADVADDLAARLVRQAAEAYANRDPDLRRLDERRLLEPDWLQHPRMVGYACYADRFAGDLRGVADRLDYLADLGVTYVHLLPLLQPRPERDDGGYAVMDYRSVRPDLGTMEDLAALARRMRARGMSLALDLVLNHVAREHEWAQRARDGEERFRRYFHVFPDRTEPDAYERTLPEVFPDFARGSFTWDEDLRAWVWTTFNAWQWDVNWANPDVLCEYADLILFLANVGVEVVRLDAIAFTWKRLGTTCQNQPEVHSLTQVLRAVARIACPALAFKAEAIVGPRELVQYLGVGPHADRVSDLAYHNSLMVQVWSMLATGDTTLARQALRSLPVTPSSGTWVCYVRCHDDIGWAIDDEDARAVGLDGFAHRRFLSDWYSGEYPGSWAHGLVFQDNPTTGDRRISGTAASLVGLRQDEDGAGHGESLARIFLAHAIAYGWGGVPVVWSGDELGQANDPRWEDEPGHEGDNRWAHRPRLDWGRAADRGDTGTVAGKVFQGLAHLGRVRAVLPQLHASADVRVVPDTDDGVLAVVRGHASGPFVGLYNVTSSWRAVSPGLLAEAGIDEPWNALGAHPVHPGEDGLVWLSPYAAWWVVERSSVGGRPGGS